MSRGRKKQPAPAKRRRLAAKPRVSAGPKRKPADRSSSQNASTSKRAPKKPADSAPLRTVRIPRELEPKFKTAEAFVRRLFAAFRHDPTHAELSLSGERYVLVRAASLSVEFFEILEHGARFDGERYADNLAALPALPYDEDAI